MRTDYIAAVHEHSNGMVAVLQAAIKIKYEEIASLEAAIRALQHVAHDNNHLSQGVADAITQEGNDENLA